MKKHFYAASIAGMAMASLRFYGDNEDEEKEAFERITKHLDQIKGILGEDLEPGALKTLKDDVLKLKSELETLNAEKAMEKVNKVFSDNEKIVKQIVELQEKNAQNQENGNGFKSTVDLFATIEKELKAEMPKLKEKAKANSSIGKPFSVEITVSKAATNMLTTAFANASGASTPIAYVYQRDFMGPAEDVRALEYILSLVSLGKTDKAALAIVDKVPTEGTMVVTAEGALKPLISFSYETRYSTAKKIAGRIKISEEALDDISFIMTAIRNELVYQHRMALQATILTHINTIAPSFVAGTLAASTQAPSNYDAIRAAIFAVKMNSKGRFYPNAVLVASADVYAMGATKDKNNNYVLPPFVLPDGSRIEGVRVIEVADGVSLTAGNIIVGDFRKLKFDNYKPFTIRIGQGILSSSTAANIQSDFECNMYTIIGESRDHIWNFSNETSAFVKGSLASIKTAIEIEEPEEA